MQGTWIRSLVQGDSICLEVTKPRSHNYQRPCAPEPKLCNKRSYHNEHTHTHTHKLIYLDCYIFNLGCWMLYRKCY